jgi:hypothetical protein
MNERKRPTFTDEFKREAVRFAHPISIFLPTLVRLGWIMKLQAQPAGCAVSDLVLVEPPPVVEAGGPTGGEYPDTVSLFSKGLSDVFRPRVAD